MALFSVSGRCSGAGTTARPSVSIYAPANSGGWLREVGIFNTTSTACAYRVARLTATGTQGSALTEVAYQSDQDALMTCFDTHSADATVSSSGFAQASLGAAIGSGVIWTFGGPGIWIPPGTTNGVGVVLATGTGQILDYHLTWEE